MKKKLFIILSVFLFLITSVYSQELFSCRLSSSTSVNSICNPDESSMNFFLNKNFINSNQILNSKVSLTFNSSTYNYAFCCKIKDGLGKVDFNTSINAQDNCPTNYKDLLYFTNTTNSKIGFPKAANFDITDYTKKLCVKIPEQFSNLDLLINESKDWSNRGYSCMFQTANLLNSVIGSCGKTFGSPPQEYTYTIWARLWESTASLKCNSDCTSNLDNRVYDSCSQQISQCSGIPSACNGALINSYVNFNSIKDVKCVAPWNIFKTKTFTNQTVKIEIKDQDKCLNFIKKKYSVILNNELVTMSIYTCTQ